MKLKYAILVSLLFVKTSIQADLDDYSYYGIETLPHVEEQKGPVNLAGTFERTGKASIDRKGDLSGSVVYQEAVAKINLVFYYNKLFKEGAYAEFAYNSTYLNWNQNPFFSEKWFNTAQGTLGFFTERIRDWEWLVNGTINIDTDRINLEFYTTYNMLLWGRHAYCNNVGLHIGLLAQTGMKIDHVYPVLGADWNINPSWKVNLIFPLNISLLYTVEKNWTVGIAGRLFDSRHRVHKHEPLSRGIWTYRATGAELATTYATGSVIANLHLGYLFGGTLKIANRHYEHKRRFDFNSSGYIGGELSARF